MLCHIQFHSCGRWLEVLKQGVESEKHPLHNMPLGGGDFMQSLFSFLTSSVMTCTLMSLF